MTTFWKLVIGGGILFGANALLKQDKEKKTIPTPIPIKDHPNPEWGNDPVTILVGQPIKTVVHHDPVPVPVKPIKSPAMPIRITNSVVAHHDPVPVKSIKSPASPIRWIRSPFSKYNMIGRNYQSIK